MKLVDLRTITTNKFILDELSIENAKQILFYNLDMNNIISAYCSYLFALNLNENDVVLDFDLFVEQLIDNYNFLRKENK